MDIRQLMYYVVLFTVPFFTVSPWQKLFGVSVGVIYGVLVLLLLVLYADTFLKSLRNISRNTVSPVPLLLFLGISVLSFLYILATGNVMREHYVRVAYLVFSSIVAWLFAIIPNDLEELVTGLKVYIAAAILAAIYGLYETVGYMAGFPTGQEIGWTVPRMYGTATEPQVFGNFILSVLPLVVATFVFEVKKFSGKMLLFAIWLFSLSLIMTFSAGAWAGAAVGISLMVFGVKEIRWRPLALAAAAFVLVVGSVLSIDTWVYPEYSTGFPSILIKFTQPPSELPEKQLPDKQGDTPKAQEQDAGKQDLKNEDLPVREYKDTQINENYRINMISVNERKWFRQAAWKMFKDHPVAGVGLGNYGNLYNKYRPEGTPQVDFYARAHNQYLEILAETGIIGFFAFLLAVSYFVVIVFTAIRQGMERSLRYIVLGLFASLAGLAIHGYAIGFLLHNYVWVIMGLTYAACRLSLCGPTGRLFYENRN